MESVIVTSPSSSWSAGQENKLGPSLEESLEYNGVVTYIFYRNYKSKL